MSTQTFVEFQQRLAKVGITATVSEVQASLENYAIPVQFFLTESHRLIDGVNNFKLGYKNVLEQNFKVYKFVNSKELIPANELSLETYDPLATQTSDVAVDYYNGLLYLLDDIGYGDTYVVFEIPDNDKSFGSFLYAEALKSPVKEVQKGDITVKTLTPLEIALQYHKLSAATGANVLSITTPRYSAGRVRGRQQLPPSEG